MPKPLVSWPDPEGLLGLELVSTSSKNLDDKMRLTNSCSFGLITGVRMHSSGSMILMTRASAMLEQVSVSHGRSNFPTHPRATRLLGRRSQGQAINTCWRDGPFFLPTLGFGIMLGKGLSSDAFRFDAEPSLIGNIGLFFVLVWLVFTFYAGVNRRVKRGQVAA